MMDDNVAQIALHEAGHITLAALYGLQINSAWIDPTTDGELAGASNLDVRGASRDAQLRVLLGGCAAVQLATDEWTLDTQQHDAAAIQRLLKCPGPLHYSFASAVKSARHDLRVHWSSVINVARLLIRYPMMRIPGHDLARVMNIYPQRKRIRP
jgi:hypothetical protein